MEGNPLEKKYDKLYSEKESAYGGENGEPELFVQRFLNYAQGGSVLELGAGQGRNGLWLARHGFSVEARDISSVGVEKMNQVAIADKLDFRAIKSDAREDFVGSYDAIVSTFVLHHFSQEEAKDVIKKMKEHTKPLGFNILSTFTQDSDFFKKNTIPNKFYPGHGELRDMYADWEVLEYAELGSGALAKKEDGTQLQNVSAKIIARRPEQITNR